MPTTRVDFRDWFRRVLGWDGVLPIGMAILPAGIMLVWPNADDALAAAAGLVPIAAVILRYYVGRHHLESNRVGPMLRVGQRVAFVAAIFWMCLLECFVMMLHFVPAIQPVDCVAVGVGYAVYLATMSFAMYPGRVEYIADEDGYTYS